jgi:hypothetical protein
MIITSMMTYLLGVNRDVSEDSEPEGQGPVVKELEKETNRFEKVTIQEVLSKHFSLETDMDYIGDSPLLGQDWDSGSGDEKANSGDSLMESGSEIAEVSILSRV